MKNQTSVLLVAVLAATLVSVQPLTAQPAFNQYSVNTFHATGSVDPRVLMVGPQGRIWVGAADGTIKILEDTNQDGVADNVITFVGGTWSPHGLAWKQNGAGWEIFVAHLTTQFGGVGKITRFVDANGDDVFDSTNPVISFMPTGAHQVNNIKMDPTGNWLYFGLGAMSDANPGSAALIGRVAPSAQSLPWGDPGINIFATGLRNAWGIEFHPSGELFATENGVDLLGPTQPPDEFNHIQLGKDYGFPGVNGVPPTGSTTEGPVGLLAPHSSTNGFAFDTGTLMSGTENQVFLAQWGGWAGTPTSKLVQAQLHQDSTGAWRMHTWDFLTTPGKPLDVCVGNDGTLYFTVHTVAASWPLGVHRVVPTHGISVKISGVPENGNMVNLTVRAPSKAGDFYFLAASLGQGPLPTPVGPLGLSWDFVFDLSLAPGPFFAFNIPGTLNASGVSSGTDAMFLPAVPALAGATIYFAALTVSPLGFISGASPTARLVIL